MKNYVLIMFCWVACVANAQTATTVTWDYPVKPGTEEWRQFTTGRQMVEACQIPQNILEALSTKDLAVICFNYPLFLNFSAYNDERKGISNMIERFNGLKELSKRKDGTRELMNIYQNYPVLAEFHDKSSEYYTAPIKLPFLELLLANDAFMQQLNEPMAIELEKMVLDKYVSMLENMHVYGIWNIRKTFLLGARAMEHRNKFADLPVQQDVIKRYIENYIRADPALLTEISKIISEI